MKNGEAEYGAKVEKEAFRMRQVVNEGVVGMEWKKEKEKAKAMKKERKKGRKKRTRIN